MSEDNRLVMSFDPRTIEHLGVKMYSRIPSAIAELIANAYDAAATQVDINLYDIQDGKSIEVVDNGWGMGFDEVNDKFLRIGRNRRDEGAKKSPCGTRKATGKKGLGKLALFGIGNTIEISTIQKDSGIKINFILDWEDLKGSKGAYLPKFNVEECDKDDQGTTIILKNIKRSSDFNKNDLAISLSKLFNFFDDTFKCFVSLNNDDPLEVSNELKYSSIDNKEFEWHFPDFSDQVDVEYENQNQITGTIIATETPLKPGLRGITLFANGRLVNEPEFFGVIESSHVFSYLTGWLNIDFIDDMEDDVIATNRQSLNWDEPGLPELQLFLQRTIRAVEKNWREERKKKRKNAIEEETEINIQGWYETLSKEIRSQIEPIIDSLDSSELSEKKQADIVKKMHTLVPEYPYYHWRHIHEVVREVSEEDYKKGDYYEAFIKTIKRFVGDIQDASGITDFKSESALMGTVFGREEGKIFKVVSKYKKPNGHDFSDLTKNSIEEGQKDLSRGLVSAARNPLAHNDYNDLRESGLFNEKDCLDALSVLSHLYRRLDDALEVLNKESEQDKTDSS